MNNTEKLVVRTLANTAVLFLKAAREFPAMREHDLIMADAFKRAAKQAADQIKFGHSLYGEGMANMFVPHNP